MITIFFPQDSGRAEVFSYLGDHPQIRISLHQWDVEPVVDDRPHLRYIVRTQLETLL